MDETIIKIENAALKLKKFVIKPANLEIPKGYIVGVQGENGAGKTTLLHMMLGMYDKMKGKIYIDGLDVVKNKTKVKELVGIVSQDRKFYLSQDANGNEKIYSHFIRTGIVRSITGCLHIWSFPQDADCARFLQEK